MRWNIRSLLYCHSAIVMKQRKMGMVQRVCWTLEKYRTKKNTKDVDELQQVLIKIAQEGKEW